MRTRRTTRWAGLAYLIMVCLATAGNAVGQDRPTPSISAGPNHRAGAPFRGKLSPPLAEGQPIVVRGHVHSTGGAALSGVVIDAYHADAKGDYDRNGFDYRGRVLTDERGYFEFETIRPSGYGGIEAHIHLIVTHAGYRSLTTELRFGKTGSHRGLGAEWVERKVGDRTYAVGTVEIVLAPSS